MLISSRQLNPASLKTAAILLPLCPGGCYRPAIVNTLQQDRASQEPNDRAAGNIPFDAAILPTNPKLGRRTVQLNPRQLFLHQSRAGLALHFSQKAF
jgi:hypothetical protein